MKKPIKILKDHVRFYQGMIELYEDNPHNQAVTEYSANEAKENIKELNEAIAILEKPESQGICDHAAKIINTGKIVCIEDGEDCTGEDMACRKD